MSDKEDQIDLPAGIGLNYLVFNEENQERRSWKFCNLCFFILIVKSQHFGFHCFHAQLATRLLIQSYEQDNFNKR